MWHIQNPGGGGPQTDRRTDRRTESDAPCHMHMWAQNMHRWAQKIKVILSIQILLHFWIVKINQVKLVKICLSYHYQFLIYQYFI